MREEITNNITNSYADSSSDNSDKLIIQDIENTERKPNTNPFSKRRKRKKPSLPTSSNAVLKEDEKADVQIDKTMEEKLQKCARKNNISPIEMKRLLRKIVGNDHVLALVKLQEEAELAEEGTVKDLSKNSEQEQESILENNVNTITKLTRSKFRQLNKSPPAIQLSNEADPDVIALITEDLHTDEEDDDEYEPKEEDFASEDDFNTTASDLDSQPRTPMASLAQIEHDSPASFLKSPTGVCFTSDGLFKLPSTLNKHSSVSQQEEIIAKRTRSKLCLEETAIETIESTFIPPDVTSDMYGFDADIEMDQDWMQFLNEFTKPLNSGHEDDDTEADPEYVAADKIPLDREELRDINIPKKELSDLVAELLDGFVQDGSFSNEMGDLETPKKFLSKSPTQSPLRRQVKFNNDQQHQQDIQTANNFRMYSNEYFEENLNENLSSNVNQSIFQPNIMSTPQTLPPQTYYNPQQPAEFNTQSYENYEDKNAKIPTSTTTTMPLDTQPKISEIPVQRTIPINYISPSKATLVAYPVQGASIPCYQIAQLSSTNNLMNNSALGQPIFARIQNQAPIAYIDLTQASSKSHPIKTQTTSSEKQPHPNYFEMWKGDAHDSAVKFYQQFYQEKFNDLQNSTDVSENSYNSNEIGFTNLQRQILDQQMRIHVQFATQNYLQMYSHPQFWQLAKPEKDMLIELESKCEGNTNSAFNAVNLKEALELIKDWEDDLSKDTVENQAFMDFVYHEINRNKSKSRHYYNRVFKFPPKTMKKILNSTVFVYPEYLPRLPFRSRLSNVYHEFTPIESHLLAFGFEKYLLEVEEEIRERPDVFRRYSIPKLLCMKLSKNLMSGKTTDRLHDFYKQQLKTDYYNPVKYFNDRKKAPKFEHRIIPIDLNSIKPPIKSLTELPMLWKEFGTLLTLTEKQKANLQPKSKKILNNRLNEVSWSKNQKEKCKKDQKKSSNEPNYVIHLNYIFNNSPTNISGINELDSDSTNPKIEQPPKNSTNDFEFHNSFEQSAWNDTSIFSSSKIDRHLNNKPDCCSNSINSFEKGQTQLTDYFQVTSKSIPEQESINCNDITAKNTLNENRKLLIDKNLKHFKYTIKKKAYLNKYFQITSQKFRTRKRLQKKIEKLLVQYWTFLYKIYKKFKHKDLQKVYINFKTIELYTDFLKKLKMNCKKACKVDEVNVKKPDEIAKLRKANRLSENIRQMLLPENKDDANKKDAIYAYNFYEKVEETLKNETKFKKFQAILKSFDPQKDKISHLYQKLENLFLPKHPELAQIFLTFLLPSEAVEIGKFFEHFMITNMGTFINKLNIFFNKQPAQLRKIYSTLNDIADDPDLNMDKIKSKILPLLKGNQFLIDWFCQIFPDEPPPESLLGVAENISLKEIESQPDSSENISPKDLFEDTSDSQLCQLRYINGRLFYGSRILLPAKLAFLAEALSKEDEDDSNSLTVNMPNKCVHGIRELGEKRLKSASTDNSLSCDENDRSEDEDTKEDGSTLQLCDESTFRMHAARINPTLYAEHNIANNFLKLRGAEETCGKSSPKKQLSKSINTITQNLTIKEKRKSPKKNLPKSPTYTITKRSPNSSELGNISNAMSASKKLKIMTSDDENNDQNKMKKKANKLNKPSSVNTIMNPASAVRSLFESATLTSPQTDENVETESENNTKIELDEEDTLVPAAWTRDEDKIILEEAKIGEVDSEETLLQKISTKLSERSKSEILERHRFLMDLLCQLKQKN